MLATMPNNLNISLNFPKNRPSTKKPMLTKPANNPIMLASSPKLRRNVQKLKPTARG